MTTPDELQRVWRVVEAIPAINDLSAQYQNDIAEALLSERAELLATVERMRGEIVFATTTLYPEALFRLADTLDRTGGIKETGEVLRMMGHNEQHMADRLRAVLTTGEEK